MMQQIIRALGLTGAMVLVLLIAACAGAVGETGLQGQRGAQGEQGIPGETGSQGQDGATGPRGPVGATGLPGETGPQGETGPPGLSGELQLPDNAELILFPEAALDFTIGSQCADAIKDRIEYSGTEQENIYRKQKLSEQLRLPTRYMQKGPNDDEDWHKVLRGMVGRVCPAERAKWQTFYGSTRGVALWDRRDSVTRSYWRCESYNANPERDPSEQWRRPCDSLYRWIPDYWLEPGIIDEHRQE